MHYTPDTIPTEAAAALAPAFVHSDVDSADGWIERCKQDTAQLWRVDGVWALSEVVRLKDGLGIHIVAMAGEYTPEVMAEIESWGKSKGCTRAYFSGRRGWERRLPDYKVRCITAVKEL